MVDYKLNFWGKRNGVGGVIEKVCDDLVEGEGMYGESGMMLKGF